MIQGVEHFRTEIQLLPLANVKNSREVEIDIPGTRLGDETQPKVPLGSRRVIRKRSPVKPFVKAPLTLVQYRITHQVAAVRVDAGKRKILTVGSASVTSGIGGKDGIQLPVAGNLLYPGGTCQNILKM